MASRPVILIVDNNPRSLAHLLDAITRRFGTDYRAIGHGSSREALDELQQLAAAAEPVALVICAQRMPEMTGLDLLSQVHTIAPGAQRAIVVGWGDANAAEMVLQGCAFG